MHTDQSTTQHTDLGSAEDVTRLSWAHPGAPVTVDDRYAYLKVGTTVYRGDLQDVAA